ncbi:hypothetical protein [Actinoallomurus iriomotensis]|uniref:Uncharacterized protein n=1 Tax=Actinoallomurus iriomotensis TaxID=478107 RepID=A0A9W6RXY7_9ACTN|nr:hypothetical protein [Actinoallomurus iriomotensis]GLY82182.1 hypothetical protein Airi02_001140 [Actinoallomurus iriomotensis]
MLALSAVSLVALGFSGYLGGELGARRLRSAPVAADMTRTSRPSRLVHDTASTLLGAPHT